MPASLDNVIQQLQENKKQNQDSLTEIRSELGGVEDVVDNVVDLVSNVEKNAEKREKNQNRVEGGKKAHRTKMENLAKKEAERFSLFRTMDTAAVKAFETLGEFAKKQYDATVNQVELIEKQRADAKADKLKNLEALREAKIGDKADAARKVVGDDIKEPTFLNKIFKLALGIFGAAVFIKLVQNFDKVKAFTTDKLIPALKSTFEFLKNTLTPVFEFIANNFEEVVTGVAVAAGAVIGAKIFIKLANIFKKIKFALLLVKSGTISLLANLIATARSLGGKFMKILRALPIAAAAVGTAMGSLLGGLGSILAPLAIPLAIVAGIAAVVAGIGFALTKLRDALGFESVFDVLMLGVMHLKDAFGHIVNAVGSVVNFILGIVETIGNYIPGVPKFELPRLDEMATDSAEEFKLAAQEKVIKAKEGEVGQTDFMDAEPVITRRDGTIDDYDAQVAALDGMVATQQQQRNLTPPQTAGGGNVANAVVNAPSTTTNVNNATTVMDAEPAIDGLDRFAMSGAF